MTFTFVTCAAWWDVIAWRARVLNITLYLNKGDLLQWEEGSCQQNRSQKLYHTTEMIGLLPKV